MKTNSLRGNGRTVIAVLALAAFVSGTIAFADSPSTPTANAVSVHDALPGDVTAEALKRGRKIFHGRGNCFHCHGNNGAGTFIAPALNDDRRIHLQTRTVEEIAERIRSGVSQPKQYRTAMPPSGGASLTNEEMSALAAYVFTLDHSQ